MSGHRPAIDISTYDPRHQMADPFPMYRALREQDPVHWVESAGLFAITSHAIIRDILLDNARWGQAYEVREVSRHGPAVYDQPYFQIFSRMLFLKEGEAHARARPLFARWFMGPARTKSLAPYVERATALAVQNIEGRRQFDIVGDYAYPLALNVISHMLGVPPEDSERIAHDVEAMAAILDSVPKETERRQLADAAMARLADYFHDLVQHRRRNMGEDLLSAIIESWDAGGIADEKELFANVLMMYLAGHDTTVSTLALSILSLHQNPDQLELLRAEPDLMPAAVEELIRYDAIAHGVSRASEEDVEVAGRLVPAGTFVLLLLAAGNRDPAVFPQPDRLDLRRKPLNILTFATGAHVCIGNMLARMELQSALAALLQRFPRLELETTTPPASQFKPTLNRGLKYLTAHA